MNKSLEYVKNQIAKLKDDLQHFTMVEKDSALASQIRYDLEQFEIIEKEFKEKDELAQALSIITCENGNLLKYKKALDFIKEKQVNYRTLLCIFNTSDNYNDYNKLYPRNKITQEEYDLFKEVLL